MGVKVATTTACFHWSQLTLSHLPPSSQTVSTSSSTKRCRLNATGATFCRFVQRSDLFGSDDKPHRMMRRNCSNASSYAFSDDEFSKKIQELALRFQLSGEEADENNNSNYDDNMTISSSRVDNCSENPLDLVKPPEWSSENDIIIPASIERKANSVDLPLSLRMIKRKLKWEDRFRESGESAYCSVKKAFSSMVFIIRELHSYSLRMRERVFVKDLQGVLVRVQKEMHDSFVWLFQQVFSRTPTLMVSVMILLANFTVYSMGSTAAIAASPPPGTHAPVTESVSTVEVQDQQVQKFDSSSLKTFKISSSGGKSTLIGGNNGGGGGKVRPIVSGTDGDGWQERADQFGMILPDGASKLASSLGTAKEAESVLGQAIREDELSLWNSIVEEAWRMRDISLDHETMKRFVSPITAEIEPDDFTEYHKTELLYQMGLAQEPNNPLLLANYAQFLYLVSCDYDRAEEYFKQATRVESPDADAEAYQKYASFLWQARKDLWAAEETFLKAVSADPTNAYYASSYAHFLWNTDGDDTCFPLSS